MTRALSRRPDITFDERGLSWLVTVAIHQAWQLASIADEVAVGSFQAGTPGEGNELPEPADPDDRSADSNVRSICRYSAFARKSSSSMPCSRCASGAHATSSRSRPSSRTSAAANREPAAVVALEQLVLGLERPHKHRGPLGLGPLPTPNASSSEATRRNGGFGVDSAKVASKKCWVRIISGRHSSDREPPAITPLGPTDSPARRVNMVESARRRYTTNRHLTAWAGRWTMTRSWTFV
jgi:hypothetical protein